MILHIAQHTKRHLTAGNKYRVRFFFACVQLFHQRVTVCRIPAKYNTVPLYFNSAVAQCILMALGLMISVNRCIAYVDRSVRRGEWLKTEMRTKGYTMDGKVIGFVGFGNIAKQLHRMLKGFEVTCRYYDAFRMTPEKEAEYGITYCSLEELMQTSDIITVHTTFIFTRGRIFGRGLWMTSRR